MSSSLAPRPIARTSSLAFAIRKAITFVLLFGALLASARAQTTTVVFGNTVIGQTSAEIQVSVGLPQGGSPALASTTTQGAKKSDFAISDSGSCGNGQPVTAGNSCTVKVTFSPLYPGPRFGAVVVHDGSGNLLGTALIAGTGLGSLSVLQPGVINTVVGDGDWIFRGDGGAAINSPIFLPTGVAEDAAGNLYLSDSNNNRIREVAAKTGVISTVAGTGVPGYSGNNMPAASASMSLPAGIVLDGAGNIYFVDNGNQCVRRVDANSTMVTTVAGVCGVEGSQGDGGPATSANLSLPEGLAIDLNGNLYIADTGNNRIRKVDASSGMITTVAGTGVFGYNNDRIAAKTAQLASPWGVAVGPDGSIYIADMDNNRVRKVDPSGMITTVAGTGDRAFGGDGSDAGSAQLNAPAAVVLDPAGNLYIADSGNNRVREVAVGGNINTIVGTDGEQFYGDTLPANQAMLYGPYSLFFDQTGNLLIADMFHNRIRSVSGTTVPLQYASIRVSKTSAPVPEVLVNDGNADMNIASTVLVNAALDPATTTCPATGKLSSGTPCNLGVEFAPLTVGPSVAGTVTVNSDAANSPDVINLSGEVLSVNPTSVALISSENPSLLNDQVTFTATISSSDTTLGGTVTFTNGSMMVCQDVAVSAAKTATCSTSTLPLGQHSIQASYTGDSDNAASVSPTVTQVVKQPTTLVLQVAPNPAFVLASVTLTATATADSGTPTGTITFMDGATAIGSANLVAGVAIFSTTQLSPGVHSLVATYVGDTADAATQSAAVSETISLADTVTTISSSNLSVPVGTAVTFTANVVSLNGTTPTGTVAFTEGLTVLGSGKVEANGVAMYTTSSLTPVSHDIVASYSGDTDDAKSSSAKLTEVVSQIGTVTAVTATPNPSSAGASVQFTATVGLAAGATADGSITGTVTFTDAGTTIGTAPVSDIGTAVLSLNTLTAGMHNIVATYGGNTNYAGSNSSVSVPVRTTSTTTSLSTSGNALAGKPVTLTATVASATGVPTGTVTFEDNGVVVGHATVNAQGIATLSISTLALGGHPLVAVYGGDTNYTGSSSNTQTIEITLATTSLTLSGPPSPMNIGQAANFTATLSTNGVAPTGTVTLRDGNSTIVTQSVNAAGAVSFNAVTLPLGTHTLTANYGGDSDNASITSNSVTLVIQQASTSTTLQTSQNPQIVGQSVTFTATVTSQGSGLSGAVSFLDGTSVLGSVPLTANGTAAFTTSSLSFGPHVITASYAGDTNHNSSVSAAITQHIVEGVQIGLSSSVNPAVSGANVSFTVKVAGSGSIVPTGAVKFLDGTSLLSSTTLDGTGSASFSTTGLAVGSHPITAVYAGDSNYSAATSSVLTETVVNANTQIALTSSANPATFGSALTFKAVVTSNGGVPTGPVTFSDSGTTIGSGVLDASGTALLTLSTLAPGSHSIVANYAGDGKASGSVSSPLVVSIRQMSKIVVASSANPSQTLAAITFTASVTNQGQNVPTGSVTFTDGSAQLGIATLDAAGNAVLTMNSLSAGSHSVTASYSGDSTNFTSVSGALAQVVTLRETTTTLSATSNPDNTQQITLIAAMHWTGPSAPTGTVTFTSGGVTLGSAALDANGVATLVIVVNNGTENVVATYSGDAAYVNSASPAVAVGNQPQTEFGLQLDPPNATIQSKQHTVVTLTVTSLNSFSDTMQYGCLGLPYAATCTFSVTQGTLKAGGTTAVQVTIDTGDPLGAGAKAENKTAPSSVLVCFVPGALLFGIGLWRVRRRSGVVTLGLLVLFGAVAASITGCSGLNVNGTPAGTYTFQVTARAMNSGVAESQTMTLTVK